MSPPGRFRIFTLILTMSGGARNLLRELVDPRRDQFLERRRQRVGAVGRRGPRRLGLAGEPARLAALVGQQESGDHQQLHLGGAGWKLQPQLVHLFIDIGGEFLDPRFLAFATGKLKGSVGDVDRHLRHGRYSFYLLRRIFPAFEGDLETTADPRREASGYIPSPAPADLRRPSRPSSAPRAVAPVARDARQALR